MWYCKMMCGVTVQVTLVAVIRRRHGVVFVGATVGTSTKTSPVIEDFSIGEKLCSGFDDC